MRGLETISRAQRNGWGPDSSLKRALISILVRMYAMHPHGQPFTRQIDVQFFRSEHTASLSSDIQRTLLLLSSRRCERLNIVEFGFGVRELLELFELQAPVFVGDDVYDEDRFAEIINPG
jgi:hypothetical protein